MPAIRRLVQRAAGVPPDSTLDPELCVAIGAGIQVLPLPAFHGSKRICRARIESHCGVLYVCGIPGTGAASFAMMSIRDEHLCCGKLSINGGCCQPCIHRCN